MEIESDFHRPPLRPTLSSLEKHFASDAARELRELPNRHHEGRVAADARDRAAPASVLIPIVDRPGGLSVLLTRRHHGISYPGHVCFPGGRADPGDPDVVHTALREAREEIELTPERVKVLGRLGDYYTHSGYRIAPVVGVVSPPLELVPHPREVEEIIEIPLDYLLQAASYRLWARSAEAERAHFRLSYAGATITGPTVSILMGLYDELARTHAGA